MKTLRIWVGALVMLMAVVRAGAEQVGRDGVVFIDMERAIRKVMKEKELVQEGDERERMVAGERKVDEHLERLARGRGYGIVVTGKWPADVEGLMRVGDVRGRLVGAAVVWDEGKSDVTERVIAVARGREAGKDEEVARGEVGFVDAAMLFGMLVERKSIETELKAKREALGGMMRARQENRARLRREQLQLGEGTEERKVKDGEVEEWEAETARLGKQWQLDFEVGQAKTLLEMVRKMEAASAAEGKRRGMDAVLVARKTGGLGNLHQWSVQQVWMMLNARTMGYGRSEADLTEVVGEQLNDEFEGRGKPPVEAGKVGEKKRGTVGFADLGVIWEGLEEVKELKKAAGEDRARRREVEMAIGEKITRAAAEAAKAKGFRLVLNSRGMGNVKGGEGMSSDQVRMQITDVRSYYVAEEVDLTGAIIEKLNGERKK
jgi:hypothetical protein